MFRVITLALATTALAACATQAPPTPVAEVAPLAAAPEAPPAPKPQYGAFGFDETGMDKSIQPGDSFYKYANGAWDART